MRAVLWLSARSLALLSVGAVSACFHEGPPAEEEDGTGSETDADGTAESTDTGPDSCGNGSVEPGEECDLAAQNSDNGACTTECKQAVCGDGYPHLGVEDCDDGNDVPDDECTDQCTHPACGDGIVQAGEQCDDGADNGPGKACSLECTADVCGDSNVGPNEECDNGMNNGPGQLCKADCTDNVCGDSDVGPNEGCDDGNTMGGDGCSAMCVGEDCGDGNVDDGEECDDGNMINTDECTVLCKGPVCGDGYQQNAEECDEGGGNADTASCTSSCKEAACGDGLVWMGQEACDDGDMDNTDACTNACELAACGDGHVQPGNAEQCDDGNGQSGDGCSSQCKLEDCGNDVVDPGEECDDGANGNQDDGCTDLCKLPECGDGIEQPNEGEDCDDGNQNNFDACPNDCQDPVCGDGIIEGLEECDGNELAGKTCTDFDFDGGTLACSQMCKFDTSMCDKCGDGEMTGPEECDDGNVMGGDGCSPICTIEQQANYAFITKNAWSGNLGGLAGADAKCQAAADAANLPGNYVALLSAPNVHARNRIAGSAGWIRTDGRPFGNAPNDIFDQHEVFYPLDRDEYGNEVFGAAWTGSESDGQESVGRTCSGWTSGLGTAAGGATDTAWYSWLSYYTLGCGSAEHLYCFGKGVVADVTPSLPKDYRLGFLTRIPYGPAGSLEKMDQLCVTEAADAGIDDNGTRTFIALLGDDVTKPIGRFDTMGFNWYRIDGVALAVSPDDFAAGKRLAPLTLGPDGVYRFARPWTGASAVDSTSPGETCKNWSAIDNQQVGRKGWAESTQDQFGWPAEGCGAQNQFYCLEK